MRAVFIGFTEAEHIKIALYTLKEPRGESIVLKRSVKHFLAHHSVKLFSGIIALINKASVRLKHLPLYKSLLELIGNGHGITQTALKNGAGTALKAPNLHSVAYTRSAVKQINVQSLFKKR